jgi:peptide/nickel transport system permease protein
MRKFRINATIGGFLLLVIITMVVVAVFWTPYDPMALRLSAKVQPPSAAHWIGTDEFGRDVLSRILVGSMTSCFIALCSVLFAIIFGSIFGVIAGYFRGLADNVLMVISNVLLAFPGILLALGLMVIIGSNQYGIIVALGVGYTPSVLRIVRASVLSVREREFVEASRVIGNSAMQTMFLHVLPNCVAPIVVLGTSMFGWAILSESGLSFLGLGVPPPAPTWGNMLSSARPYLESAPWLGIAPGLCIAATLLGINLLGDALRDGLDPRMENRQ